MGCKGQATHLDQDGLLLVPLWPTEEAATRWTSPQIYIPIPSASRVHTPNPEVPSQNGGEGGEQRSISQMLTVFM